MSDSNPPEVKATKEEERTSASPDEVKESVPAAKAAEVVPVSEQFEKTPVEEGTSEPKDTAASPGAKGSKDEKKKPRKRPPPKKDSPKKEQQQEKGDEKESKEEEENSAEVSRSEGDLKNAAESPRVRKAPYINPDRFKTGGQQKEKLSDEALVERMERIRLNNEKIKERRLTVEADEQAFKASQEVLRQKQVAERRIQDGINRSREQNAQRKMEKIQGREWDSEKNQRGGGPQSPVGRGRGRGGPPFTPTRTPSAKVDSPGSANLKTPVRTPAKVTEASLTRTPSITRDAPPHSAPTSAVDASDQAS